MKKLTIFLLFLFLVSCSQEQNNNNASNKSKPFEVTIDWVPSPEYYGFFVANEEGLYKKAGLEVTIKYGSGAPVVANQIASNSIYAGTTTSDNVLRQVALGGEFYKAVPIIKFNPAVLVSLKDNPIESIDNVNGKTIGVNKQSSVYQQFLYILGNNYKVKANSINEFPIGWGGAAQLENGQIDAFLAYTTNAAIDLKAKNININEIIFSDEGVHLYGLVLVFASKGVFEAQDIAESDIDKFIQATLEGYRIGGENVQIAVDALMKAEPTLDGIKISKAVERIRELNSTNQSDFEKLDQWVRGPKITEGMLEKAKALYK